MTEPPSSKGDSPVQIRTMLKSVASMFSKIRLLLGFFLLPALCYSQVSANFSTTPYTVPANALGVNMTTDPSSTINSSLSGAKFTRGRMFTHMDQIFSASNCTSQTCANFSTVNTNLTAFAAIPIHPILVLIGTPAWLQPTWASSCTNATHAPPTSDSSWGTMAASVVAYVDSSFPGLVTDYEIWNEPDDSANGSLCSQLGTDADRLTDYLSIYGGAGPAMKTQASTDGVAIKIGGPVLATTADLDEWLLNGTTGVPHGLLTDSATYPYVDFVSYHHYLNGSTYANISTLVTATTNQIPTKLNNAFDDVVMGDQPSASSTPIYISETNDSAGQDPTGTDCCRNKAPYSGPWNVLSVIREFSGVYSDTNAKIPYLYYYTVEQHAGFCMFGLIDTDMDCNNTAFSAYPQYYAYKQLELAGLQGNASGGALLTGTQPTVPSGTFGMSYKTQGTSPSRVIVVSNPTTTDFTSQTWTFNNVSSVTTANAYTLNQNGQGITTTHPTLTLVGTTGTVTVEIPANSAVAVTIQ
jgi:hypothetical protein